MPEMVTTDPEPGYSGEWDRCPVSWSNHLYIKAVKPFSVGAVPFFVPCFSPAGPGDPAVEPPHAHHPMTELTPQRRRSECVEDQSPMFVIRIHPDQRQAPELAAAWARTSSSNMFESNWPPSGKACRACLRRKVRRRTGPDGMEFYA